MFKTSFNNFLKSRRDDSTLIDYQLTPVQDLRENYCNENIIIDTKPEFKVRFPHRLNMPLIDFSNIGTDTLENHNYKRTLPKHLLKDLNTVSEHLRSYEGIKFDSLSFSHGLKPIREIINKEFPNYEASISKSCDDLVSRFMRLENELITSEFNDGIQEISIRTYMHPFIKILSKFRLIYPYLISMRKKSEIKDSFYHELSRYQTHRASVTLYRDNSYKIVFDNELSIIFMGHYVVIHLFYDNYFYPMDYIDYLLTIFEVERNLFHITQSPEYFWLAPLSEWFEKMMRTSYDHNSLVEFFSLYESLCLFMIDSLFSEDLSWAPIIEIVDKMIKICIDKFQLNINYEKVYMMIQCRTDEIENENFFYELLSILQKLNKQQLAEVSSLHKFMWYAIIDEEKGMEKFIKRTHTKRPVDQDAIRSLIGRFNIEFIISFHKRHMKIPNMRGNQNKIDLISTKLSIADYTFLTSYNMEWFYDIEIYNALTFVELDNPIEYAKDKGSTKHDIYYNQDDAVKELIDVIRTEDYQADRSLLIESEYKNDKEFIIRHESDTPKYFEFVCRIAMKEREQKPEGRAFGCAPTDQKHALSNFMYKAKQVLDYFDGQIMTPTDERRKMILHEASQLLKMKDNYCIMSDIEGHNQSMQEDNTYELLKRIGLIFGEDKWGNLVYLFSIMEVYYAKHFENKVFISRGQLGGIEGWMNPVWTLHTTLYLKELAKQCNLLVLSQQVYSDDTCLIVNLGDVDPQSINQLYNDMKECSLRYGMILKSSQTVISPSRITMLRNHYVDGQRSDSTLKKLLSLTMFNSERLTSEEIEADGILSTISSAIEATNHPLTCNLLKWIAIIQLTLRTFSASLVNDILHNKDFILFDELEAYEKSLLYSVTKVSDDKETMIKIIENFKAYQTERNSVFDASEESSEAFEGFLKLYGTANDFKKFCLPYVMMNIIPCSDALFTMYLMRLTLPLQLGGLNVPFLMNMCVKGASINMLEQLSYIRKLADYESNYQVNPIVIRKIISNVLISNPENYTNWTDELRLDMEERLITSHYPIFNKVKQHQEYIKRYIKSIFNQECVNKVIRKYLELDKEKSKYNQALINIFRSKFVSRVVRFYADNSIFTILDLILQKVEITSSFLDLGKNIEYLRASLFSVSQDNMKCLYLKNSGNLRLDTIDEVLITLEIERRHIFNEITFLDIDEVSPNDYLSKVITDDRVFAEVVPTMSKRMNGIDIQTLNVFGSTVKIKTAGFLQNVEFKSYQAIKAIKNALITKWIIASSIEKGQSKIKSTDKPEQINVICACNLNLMLLIKQKYKDIEKYIPETKSGEILHRIADFKFRNQCLIRCCFNEISRISVHIDSIYLDYNGLNDSNLNIDFARMILLFKFMFAKKYNDNKDIQLKYHVINNPNIKNVRFDFLARYTEPEEKYLMTTDLFQTDIDELRNLVLKTLPTSMLNDNWMQSTVINDLCAETLDLIIGRKAYDMLKKRSNMFMPLNEIYSDGTFHREFIYNYSDILSRMDGNDDHEKIERSLKLYVNSFFLALNKRTNYDMSLIKADIINKLIERNISIDILYKTMSTYSERVFNLLKNIRSDDIVTKEKIMESSSKYKNIIDEISLTGIKTIMKIIIYMICDSSLVINITSGKIKVNVDESISILDKRIFAHKTYKEILPFDVMIKMFNIDVLIERLTIEDKNYIRNILSNVVQKLNLIDYQFAYDEKVSKYEEFIDTNDIELISFIDIPIVTYKVDLSIFYDFNRFRPYITIKEHVAEMYADPIVNDSITGSDTMMIAYNVMKELKIKFKLENARICDLTAGRGDFSIALRKLRFNKVDSYARRDTFTSFYRSKSVIINEHLNIFDFDTLPTLNIYDLVIVDISFIKNNKQSTNSQILFIDHLVENKVDFLLRINSYNISKNENWDAYQNYIFHIIEASDTIYMHKNIYLYGRCTKHKHAYKTEKLLSESYWYLNIYYNVFRSLQRSSIYRITPSIYGNSVIIYFSRDTTAHDIIKSISEGEYKSINVRAHNRIINNITLYKKFLIEDEHSNELAAIQDNIIVNDVKEMVTQNKDNPTIFNSLNRLIGHNRIINLFDLSIKELKKLRLKTSISMFKFRIYDVITIKSTYAEVRFQNKDENDIIKILTEKLESTRLTKLLSKQGYIKKLLIILLVSLKYSNFNWGINYLYKAIRYVKRKHKYKYQQILIKYRRLKSLFNRLNNDDLNEYVNELIDYEDYLIYKMNLYIRYQNPNKYENRPTLNNDVRAIIRDAPDTNKFEWVNAMVDKFIQHFQKEGLLTEDKIPEYDDVNNPSFFIKEEIKDTEIFAGFTEYLEEREKNFTYEMSTDEEYECD